MKRALDFGPSSAMYLLLGDARFLNPLAMDPSWGAGGQME
jgi:hypothetical protein